MKHYELLRMCADKLEKYPSETQFHDLILIHPHHCGRFPFSGGGTEKLNETQDTSAYSVPITQVLVRLARGLKELAK